MGGNGGYHYFSVTCDTLDNACKFAKSILDSFHVRELVIRKLENTSYYSVWYTARELNH